MPRHFTVMVHGLNASVRPSSIDNVVVVNGKQLGKSPHVLNDGDEILAGSGRFVFFEDSPRTLTDGTLTPGRAYLIDENAHVAHDLINRSTPIGRDSSNAVVVDDATASRFHAEVRREAGGFALHSMGSAGTRVNGVEVAAPVMLADGDLVEIAFHRLRFSTNAGDTKQASATAAGETRTSSRRHPTLATAKMSVVRFPDTPGSQRLRWIVGVLVVVLAALAYVFARAR
jgi:pSer/pThr/pTyr-binding forkhead associated (FHA) protein